ncbi:hypothetical protein [Leptolyngbya sp. FACHB-16]|uniref:hypothetical protein n=1 Tax=unclassified Leptolyngbya TaxID=2650499 RepID=UPI0016845A16
MGLVLNSPALAEPMGALVGQPSIATSIASPGAAKDLLGGDGKPVYKSIEPAVSKPTSGIDYLKQVSDSINKSFDRKQIKGKPDHLQVEIKLPANSKSKNIKKGGLPVSDR